LSCEILFALVALRIVTIGACGASKIELSFGNRTMAMKKRPRGRPRKKQGGIEPWQFARVALVLFAYDDARKRGEKHRDAVTEAVDYVRHWDPDVRISESEARRILSNFRSRNSTNVLRFECSVSSKKELQRDRWIRKQLAALRSKKGVALPELPNTDLRKNALRLKIRVVRRPRYPRHNRKTSEK
jgi:hypothetical protein